MSTIIEFISALVQICAVGYFLAHPLLTIYCEIDMRLSKEGAELGKEYKEHFIIEFITKATTPDGNVIYLWWTYWFWAMLAVIVVFILIGWKYVAATCAFNMIAKIVEREYYHHKYRKEIEEGYQSLLAIHKKEYPGEY